jgi:hypothetical protein
MRDVVLWHCEARDDTSQTPQCVGPNLGSFVDKRLADTADGQALLRAMVMWGVE